jgi:hypothetical protein
VIVFGAPCVSLSVKVVLPFVPSIWSINTVYWSMPPAPPPEPLPEPPDAMKAAETEQLPVTAPVVYVFPESVPPQPVTEEMLYPVLGVTVNETVDPLFTVCTVAGLILPPAPADGVTV